MQEVVERVLAVEKNAAERTEEARRQAALARGKADEQAAALIVAAKEDAARIMHERIAAARLEAEALVQGELRAAEERNALLFVQLEAKMDALAEAITDTVFRTGLEGD